MERSSWQGKNLFAKRVTAWPCHGVPTAKGGHSAWLKLLGLCLFVFRLAFLSPPLLRQPPDCLSCTILRPARGQEDSFLPLTFDFHVSLVSFFFFFSQFPGHTEQNMLVPWVWVLATWRWVGALLSFSDFHREVPVTSSPCCY